MIFDFFYFVLQPITFAVDEFLQFMASLSLPSHLSLYERIKRKILGGVALVLALLFFAVALVFIPVIFISNG